RIETDARGEPTGRFFEDTLQPLAEFTLFRHAPPFTEHDRIRTLAASKRHYNRHGTTGAVEGQGVAPEVVAPSQALRAANQQTLRARLVFSPGWSDASADDVRAWVREQVGRLDGKGQGDDWLRMAGLFAEPWSEPDDARLRAACAPRTGWAGFHYDCGLP